MIPQVQDFAPTATAARAASIDPQRRADPRPPLAFQDEVDRKDPRGPVAADRDDAAPDALPPGVVAAPASAAPTPVPRHGAGDAPDTPDTRDTHARAMPGRMADALSGAVPTFAVSTVRVAGETAAETTGDLGGVAPGAGVLPSGGAPGAASPSGGADGPMVASGRLANTVSSGVAPSGAVLASPPLADGGAGVAMGAQGVAADAPGAGGETAARVSAPVVASGAPLSQAPAAGVPPTLVPVAGADATAHSPVGRRGRGDAAGSARATPASGVTPTTAPAPQAAMIRPDAAPLSGTSGGAGALPDPGSSGEPGAGRAHDAATGGVFAAAPVGHGAPPAPHIASAADMPGVSRQILAALAQSPGGAVDVTLSPDELGRVRLSLSTTDLGGIVVNVTADRAETMDLIRRHIDMLAQDFREIGYGSVSFGFSDNPGRNDGHAPVALAGSHPAPVALSVIPEIALVPAAGTGLDLRL